MKIKAILDLFYEKMTQITLYQRAANDLMMAEIKELVEHAKFIEKNPQLKDFDVSMNNMMFHEPTFGKPIFYGHKNSSIDERIASVYLHKNKQYQWLLAEAYEEFEDFLEAAYASAGYYDKSFWPPSDYNGTPMDEVLGKDWAWHLNQATTKKGLPKSIFTTFRQKFTDMSKIEKSNKLNFDLTFAFSLISHLRHHIVHTAGKVANKEVFIKKVLDEIGRFNNGKPSAEFLGYIDYFFGSGEHENTINLLERRVHRDIPFRIENNPVDMLCRFLLAQAFIIAENISVRQEKP